MNKEEFVSGLQRALSGSTSAGEVAEHVRYYREYIDSEIHRGRTEEEVLAGLGDPRLLARSIIDANKRAGAAAESGKAYEEAAGEMQGENGYGQESRVRKVMLPGWFFVLIFIVAAVIVIGLVSSLLYLFAPVIMAVLIVMLVVRLIQDNRR